MPGTFFAPKGKLIGPFWAFTFVILEAVQAVFFGGVFQHFDSFAVGAAVFGFTSLGALVWTGLRRPNELRTAREHPGTLFKLCASTVFVWVSYLLALQLIEPAVAFAVFSGITPLAILAAFALGFPEASPIRNSFEGFGLLVVGVGMSVLAAATYLGHSGFVRGDQTVALAGLGLTCLSATSMAAMMIYSQRFDRLGVGPLAQFGLRFQPYTVLALLGVWAGLDAKVAADPFDFTIVVMIGFAVIAFPVFAMQKAISLMPTMTVASIAALGPLFVFLLQMVEARVDYAPATLSGLLVYCAGAILIAYGAATQQRRRAARL